MFKIGERVKITSIDGVASNRGTICGHGFFQSEHYETLSPAYIIRLDAGVWTEDRVAFLSVLVVHPDNVEEVNDE